MEYKMANNDSKYGINLQQIIPLPAPDNSQYQENMFLFLHDNICCGYSLEAPRRGASNEYYSICFRGEIRKNNTFLFKKARIWSYALVCDLFLYIVNYWPRYAINIHRNIKNQCR